MNEQWTKDEWVAFGVWIAAIIALVCIMCLSGCGGLFGTSGVQAGPQLRNGGQEAVFPDYAVTLTKDGYAVKGQVGPTSFTYEDQQEPNGTRIRRVQAAATPAPATKTSQGWQLGLLFEMGWLSWAILIIIFVLAVWLLPGFLAKLIGGAGEALGLFVRKSTAASIVATTQVGRQMLAKVDATNAAAIGGVTTPPAPASALASFDDALEKMPAAAQRVVLRLKAAAKAGGGMTSAT